MYVNKSMTFEEYVAWQNAQSVVEPDIITWSENNSPEPQPVPPRPPNPIPQEEDTVME